MFAYCGNNPASLIDPFGLCGMGVSLRFSNQVSNCLFDGMLGVAGVALVGSAILVGAKAGSALAEVLEETAEQITAWVKTQITQKEPQDNSVYVLKDPNDGNLVKYVGRTNDPARRLYEHQHDFTHPWRQDYTMTVLVTGLTKENAMLWEQTIISAYTLCYLENARREIAVKNTEKYRSHLGAVTEIITGLPANDIIEFIKGR